VKASDKSERDDACTMVFRARFPHRLRWRYSYRLLETATPERLGQRNAHGTPRVGRATEGRTSMKIKTKIKAGYLHGQLED